MIAPASRMHDTLQVLSTYARENVSKRHTLYGGMAQVMVVMGFVLAASASLSAQACLLQLFQTGAFASLTPSASSHQVLIRQSDGSYTAYEIPYTAPYQALSTVPAIIGSG